METSKTLSKTCVLTLILCFSTFSLLAQSQNNIQVYSKAEAQFYKVHWFADLNVGTRMFGATSSQADLGLGLNVNAGLGYLFTERFGIKGRLDFNSFEFTPGIGDDAKATASAYSISLEALTDLIALIEGTTSYAQDWKVIIHGGLGFSAYSGKDFKENYLDEEFQDDYRKGNDNMGHIILGITPQYHLSTKWSLNLDFSTFLLIKQDFTFDNFNGERFNGLGNISAVSLGLTFRP